MYTLCRYDIDDGKIRLVYCFFPPLNVSSVFVIQSKLSSLLQTGMISLLISILCCANKDLTRYHLISTQAPLIPAANSTLFNGLGRYAGGPNSPLAVVNVSAGKRYRFRLISVSCDPNFIFSIDGHNMVSR